MIHRSRSALGHLRARHGGSVVVGLLAIVALAGVAVAYWTTTGSGSGAASAATLPAPTAVAGVATQSTVAVSFAGVSAPAGSVTGYYVTRYLGATPSAACGTNPATATYLAPTATGCSDTGVANGTYTYTVTAVFNSWTATSAASGNVVVNADITPPTQVVTVASGAAYGTGTTVYYRAGSAGSLTLRDAVTDTGVGPGSAAYPAIAATGWTHGAETVTAGTGSAPTITYTSSAFSWTAGPSNPATYTVTGADLNNNTVATNLTFVPDSTGPTGGALTVNGVVGTAGGASGYSTTGTYTGTRTDYSADTGSGFVSSVLTREVGTLSNGACSAYAAPTTIVGAPSETAVATGCYRYTLTGTDRVGNTSVLVTVIQVDRAAPTQTFSASNNGSVTGTTVYYRSATAGSFTLNSAVTDGESGPKQVAFPAIATAGWTHNAETVTTGLGSAPTISYGSSTYSWTANPTNPTTVAARTMTASDLAGNTTATALTFTPDNTAPVGGALGVNAVAATAGGSTSSSSTGSYAITRTDYTDAGSGLASSVLTRSFATYAAGVCGTYGSPTVIVGNPAESGLTDGCYRYVLTGTDNVGNAVSLTTTVLVDATPPTQVVTMSGGAGVAVLSGTTVYYKPSVAGTFTLNDAVTDPVSGPKQAVYPAIATTGWTHAAQTVNTPTGSTATLTYASSAFSWTANPSVPASYVVTGSNQAGGTTATALTFAPDTTGPTGGALTVAGATGTAGGSTAYSSTGTFTGTFTNYNADAGAGYQATTLTRAYAATLTNGVCGTYAAPTTIASISETGVAAGCYRYTLTGTDVFGNASALVVVVQVDKTAPSAVVLSETSANAYFSGGVLYYKGGSAGSMTLTAAVTDGQSGPKQATFPLITSSGWTHGLETVTAGTGANPTVSYTSTTYSWTASPSPPTAAERTITGADQAGNTTTTTPTFTSDTTAPTGGALVLNGVAATAGGSTSNTTATSWPITTRTDYSADTGSGLASSVLTREQATWNGTTCGTYAAPVTIVGTAAQTGMVGGSCYRYVLTGTDNVGNVSTLTTTVRTGIAITSVTLANGGAGSTAGTLNRGDTITVQYSGPMSVSSMCSTWSGDTTNQSITADGVVAVSIHNGGTANDYMDLSTTSAACGGAFHFGTLTLGSNGYLVSTPIQTFGGTGGTNVSTIAYNASTYTLTITLGINETTPGVDGSNNVPGNTTATLAPDPAILGSTGLSVTGTGTTTNSVQF